MDFDLYTALKYAENSEKTDKRLYVSGINCSRYTAYEEMTAVKKLFGEKGCNIAYHGYQSFENGEVTPEEAHIIGVETARRMWGKDYQVVVTTHLNTDNLHNHFVVNSVSFHDGRKFRNKIGDHMELRKISDQVCREYGKSVLEGSNFYSGGKRDFEAEKAGALTHRQMLRRDIDEAVAHSYTPRNFIIYMENLGYRLSRDESHKHPAWIAPGWQRSVRMDSLGEGYSYEDTLRRINEGEPDIHIVGLQLPKCRSPLADIESRIKAAEKLDGLQLTFRLIITLLRLCTGSNAETQKSRPLSPEMRAELKKLDKHIEEYKLLCDFDIESQQELSAFKAEVSVKIAELENMRYTLRLKIRRAGEPESAAQLKSRCMDITKEITPLRNNLKIAERIEQNSVRLDELLDAERQAEAVQYQNKNREHSR